MADLENPGVPKFEKINSNKLYEALETIAELEKKRDESEKRTRELAEVERPEVVAWQYRVTAGPQTGWSLLHPGKGEEFERSYTVERRPLMTVAQHERIVAALARPAQTEQQPVAWVEVKDRHEGPYEFHGIELLDSGKHNLYAAPIAQTAKGGE